MSVNWRTEAIFARYTEYGKSPCFLRCSIFTVVNLEQMGLVLCVVNIENCLESVC